MNGPGSIAPEDARPASEIGGATHLFLLLFIVLCLAFAAWAWLGRLGVVSVAEGEIVPSSQVKTVQHLEGGIVREILVREGQRVKRGQSLIVLESTSSGADVSELKTRITGLEIDIVRLEAEATGAKAPEFGRRLRQSSPGLLRDAINTFASRQSRLESEITTQKEIVAQRRETIREVTARIRNRRATLKLLEEQITISEDLLKDQLTNRYLHLNLLKEAASLKGGIEEDRSALRRAGSAEKEAASKLKTVRVAFQEDARKELEAARRQFDEFTPRLAKFEDSLKRTTLRSPVDGVIKTMHVATIGGVLRPGGAVADIVPAEDRLIIEAKLPTQDIGFVQAGQQAVIRLASSDAMRFDSLSGSVVAISPDTLETPEGIPFYKVRIQSESDHFQRGAIRYALFPGMRVTTSIITGERRVWEYLLDPFLDSAGQALRER